MLDENRPMETVFPDDSHPGLRVTSHDVGRTLASGSVIDPECADHDVTLGTVDDLPGLTLRESHTIGACPECFEDKRELQRHITEHWGEYQTAFEERSPPVKIDPYRNYLK